MQETAEFEEPLTRIEITVGTASTLGAGTNSDVYLRINDTHPPFLLDKRNWDDFEYGDVETYSIAIDDLIRQNAVVSDIHFLQLEKEFHADDWKLASLTVRVNGREVYRRTGINRWLRSPNVVESGTLPATIWRAPAFSPFGAPLPLVPVWIALHEEDGGFGGGGDATWEDVDINPYGYRDLVAFPFFPSGSESTATRIAAGGDTHGDEYGDFPTRILVEFMPPPPREEDDARLQYRIWAVAPQRATTAACPQSTAASTATAKPGPGTTSSGTAQGTKVAAVPATAAAPKTTTPAAGTKTTPATAPAAKPAAPSTTPKPAAPATALEPAPATVIAPANLPDLVITDMRPTSITVKNRGTGAVGYFNVLVGTVTHRFRPLAAGETVTRALACKSGTITARLDPANLVAESDEANNAIVRNIVC